MKSHTKKTRHIESALNEIRSFAPPAQFAARARLKPKDVTPPTEEKATGVNPDDKAPKAEPGAPLLQDPDDDRPWPENE